MCLHTKIHWEAPPIFFMHVPKTAGSSLRALLTLAYARPDTLVLEYPYLYRYTRADLRRYRCYISQCGPNMPALIGRPDLAVVTILRDPVERAISLIYFHQDNLAKHPEWFRPDYHEQYKHLVRLDLRGLLADPHVRAMIEDNQTRMVGMPLDFRSMLADGSLGGQRATAPFGAPRLEEGWNLDQALNYALSWLDEMAVVGLTERFAESVILICDLLGIPQPERMPQARIGPQKLQVDIGRYRATTPPDLIAQVEALTQRDRALYAHAAELFEQQWSRRHSRCVRIHSIAPQLRMPVKRARLRAKSWLKRRRPEWRP